MIIAVARAGPDRETTAHRCRRRFGAVSSPGQLRRFHASPASGGLPCAVARLINPRRVGARAPDDPTWRMHTDDPPVYASPRVCFGRFLSSRCSEIACQRQNSVDSRPRPRCADPLISHTREAGSALWSERLRVLRVGKRWSSPFSSLRTSTVRRSIDTHSGCSLRE
jgi:hypothetical protein